MRADRLLSILLQLQLHGRLTGRELAKRLEVSERTIHRDMGALGSAGVPVVAERGARGGWSLMEGYRTNLTGLTNAEAQAIFVGGPARLLADLHLEKASDAALVKLLAVLPSVSRRNAESARQRIHIDVTGWNRASEPVPHLPALQEAVWRERKTRIVYGDSREERVIDPLGLVAKGSVWYVAGGIDGTVRTYRVSRIQSAEILEEPFVRPAGFDLPRYWEESAVRFRERLPRFPAVLRAASEFMPWMRMMLRFGAIDQICEVPEGRVEVALHFDSEDVARTVLLGFGDRIEVIEPAALRESIAAMAARVAVSLATGPAAADRAPTA